MYVPTDIGLPYAIVADEIISLIEEKGCDYDAIILDEAGYDDGSGVIRESYVVKEPTQIKSVTENVGTFDKNNPDRRYSIKMDEDILKKHETLIKAYARMATEFEKLRKNNANVEIRKGKMCQKTWSGGNIYSLPPFNGRNACTS